jgi:acyl-CoA synthetase (NDP forming)
VLLCPTAVTDPVGTAETIVALRKKYTDKPILVVYIGGVALEAGTKILAKYQIPYFTFPEPAVLSLEGLARYAEIKEMNLEKPAPPWPGVSQDAVKAVFYEVIRQHRVVLLGSESARVGKAYGLPVCPTRLATTPEEAVAIAAEMGYPVVLKIASPKVLHKTDVGGVQVGLQNAAAVKNGFVSILESVQRYFPGTPLHGVEVQKMMPPGTELIVGMTRDIHFGPLLAFGLGGIYVNLLKDVAFRLAHRLSLKEIKAMIAETRAYTVLGGYRGAEPGDIPAVIEVIARVAQLVLDFPEITELDINPLIAYRQGVSALDVKIIIEALKPEEPEAKSETRQVVM